MSRISRLSSDLERLGTTVIQLFQGTGEVSGDRVRLSGPLLLEPRGEGHRVPETEVDERVVRPEEALKYLLSFGCVFACDILYSFGIAVSLGTAVANEHGR